MYVRRWPRISASSRTPPTESRANFRPSVRAIDWPSEVLPTPGGPTKQRIWPGGVLLELRDGEVLDDPLLHLLEVVVVLVEDLARAVEIEVVGRRHAPRQRREPVEVGADHAVLGRRRREPLEPRELAVGRLAHVLGQLERVEPLAQLVRVGLLGIALAQLLLDRLHLLAEEELALALLELRLHLRLDLRAELEDLELAVEDLRDLAQPLLGVGELEDPLLLLGLEPEGGGDEVAEAARVVDVRGRDLELLGQVRREADDPPEETLRVPQQRLELAALLRLVGHGEKRADEVRVVGDRLLELDPAHALHEDPQRPVGDADHLVHDRGRPDLVEVVPARRLDVRVAHRDEREQALAAHDVVDEPDRALLADRERRHRVGEDDGFLQRQHRQLGRDLVDCVGAVSVNSISFIAAAPRAAASRPRRWRSRRRRRRPPPSSMRRSNGPYSISTC